MIRPVSFLRCDPLITMMKTLSSAISTIVDRKCPLFGMRLTYLLVIAKWGLKLRVPRSTVRSSSYLLHPPPVLNRPSLIFPASSIPEIVTTELSNRLNPNISPVVSEMKASPGAQLEFWDSLDQSAVGRRKQ